MHFQVLTFFPELYENWLTHGLMSRAVAESRVSVTCHNFRDHALNAYGQVDDSPYGGGSGMVLRPEPAVAAIEAAKAVAPGAKVVLLTPRGAPLNQKRCAELASPAQNEEGLILICCRYEGIDERIVENWVDEEVSMGDFILMGGDIPAMALMESVSRLLPGVLGNPESIQSESFVAGLLEHPQYTKPQEFRSHSVPPVLLSGNHAYVERWRHDQAIDSTKKRRPELLDETLTDITCELSVALMHYPVIDKRGDIIASSVTNLDLHDIARSSTTYGLTRYYVVHPTKALRQLVGRICDHWESGYGKTYNPNRSEALERIRIVREFDDVLHDIESRTGQLPVIVSTDARKADNTITFRDFRLMMKTSTRPHLILLGTAWGLASELLDRADYRLEPINGPGQFNHLSVRSAAAIMFDRLRGA